MINVERVQKLIQERNLTYKDIAEKTGMFPSAAHRYCNGTTKTVPADKLAALAKVLGTTPEYLMGTEEEDPRNEEEREALALYNSLSEDNKAVIYDLMKRLRNSQIE